MSKLMECMAAEEDFEPNQDSSFSEDEHLPGGGATERPLTPGGCCERVGGCMRAPTCLEMFRLRPGQLSSSLASLWCGMGRDGLGR